MKKYLWLLFIATTAIAAPKIQDADVKTAAAITRSKLATGSINQVVINDGTGLFSSEATLAVTRGGTASASLATNGVLIGNGTGPINVAGAGASNRAFIGNTLATPSFQQISLTTDIVTGSLPTNVGGTGQSNYTSGQLLIGNTATNSLSRSVLTAGSNITITNGNGSITIAASGGGGGVSSYGILLTSTCTITAQYPAAWVTSVSNPSTGNCTLTFAGGVFATRPACAAMASNDVDNGATISFNSTTASSTNLSTTKYDSGTGTRDTASMIICVGS